MLSWLRPDALAETYRDPVSWAVLAVDLFPIYALIQFGWDATALVFLYWLENLIIGGVTLLRMLAASTNNGPFGVASLAFLGPFFTIHYGMFCFVHGIFLAVFAAAASGGMAEADFMGPLTLVGFALSTGEQMGLFVGAIIALQLFLYVRDFLGRGAFREATIQTEMMKPYGRIILLHFALFAGFGLMVAFGQPMIGVLGLILLRALWGVYQSHLRHIQPQRESLNKVDEASPI
ncbi:DUF6498-containing protein [Henriciella sp.]|uniref:DUF6498-containing protein n=1 Tax=Henriciella sp. TaxID=1968823 RepID=UPI002618D928|nr:DUF6498-containing protein [Henriciella sp.]